MDGQKVKQILVDGLGEENVLDLIPASKFIFDSETVEKISINQYHSIVDGIENFFVEYMQSENIDHERVDILQKLIQDLRELENVSKENESEKTMLVCNSEIFHKNEKIVSTWLPSCLVSLDISFSKSFEIAPDIKSDENNHSVLSMIHKWKGLKSNCAPIVIPIEQKEMEQFLLGSLVMFSIFDSSRCKFPIVLDGPDSCRRLLQIKENHDWTDMGQLILEAFDLTGQKLGIVLRKHLQNIVNAETVIHSERTKGPKRKKVEENLVDVWSERRKNYFSNIAKKK